MEKKHALGSSSIASATACGATVLQRSAEPNNSKGGSAAGPTPSASAARGATTRGTSKRRAPVCLICPDRRLVSSYLWDPPSDLICVFWGRHLILSVPGPSSGFSSDPLAGSKKSPKSTKNRRKSKKIALI